MTKRNGRGCREMKEEGKIMYRWRRKQRVEEVVRAGEEVRSDRGRSKEQNYLGLCLIRQIIPTQLVRMKLEAGTTRVRPQLLGYYQRRESHFGIHTRCYFVLVSISRLLQVGIGSQM